MYADKITQICSYREGGTLSVVSDDVKHLVRTVDLINAVIDKVSERFEISNKEYSCKESLIEKDGGIYTVELSFTNGTIKITVAPEENHLHLRITVDIDGKNTEFKGSAFITYASSKWEPRVSLKTFTFEEE